MIEANKKYIQSDSDYFSSEDSDYESEDEFLHDEYDYDDSKQKQQQQSNSGGSTINKRLNKSKFSISQSPLNNNSNESTPESINGMSQSNSIHDKITASLSDYEEEENNSNSPILSNLFQKFLNREVIKNLQQRQAFLNSRLERLKKVVDPRVNKIRERGQSLKNEKERIKELIKFKKNQLNDQMNAPPFLRLMDKFAFTIGLIVLFISEFVLLRSPENFYLWYTVLIVPLMIFRFVDYHRAKYHYFMLDFCYLCQILLLFYLFGHSYILGEALTGNLFKLVFALCNGPLAWGTIVWRNSLVFHDVDKLTSVFIHLCPPIVTYCLRWYPHSDFYTKELACGGVECNYTLKEAYLIPICLYIFWQVFYYVKTEVVDQSKLENDKDIMTSLRWMSIKQPHPLYKYCVKRGWNLSPLFILMLVQLVYTLGTLLTVPLLMKSFYLHTGFLIFIFVTVSWNGSNYYFDVFSESYSKRLLKEASEKQQQAANNNDNNNVSSPSSDSSTTSSSSSSNSYEQKKHRLKITSIYSFFKFLLVFLISLPLYLKFILSI